jgi:hypothetical protein
MGVLDEDLDGELDWGAGRGLWTGSLMETSTGPRTRSLASTSTGRSTMGPWTGSSPGTFAERSSRARAWERGADKLPGAGWRKGEGGATEAAVHGVKAA